MTWNTCTFHFTWVCFGPVILSSNYYDYNVILEDLKDSHYIARRLLKEVTFGHAPINLSKGEIVIPFAKLLPFEKGDINDNDDEYMLVLSAHGIIALVDSKILKKVS